MTAEGKITVNGISERPLGTVRILITDDRLGLAASAAARSGGEHVWYPTRNKTGMVAATVLDMGTARGNRRTRYDLITDRGAVANLSPSQTFWLAPAGSSTEATPAPRYAPNHAPDAIVTETEPDRITVKQLKDTQGVRVLITDQHEHSGGGKGEWRAARKAPARHGELTVPGEPAGVHAATVLAVKASDRASRWDVVTNLGTVEGVTNGQAFRLAPADMEDSAVIRKRLRADREATEARQAYDQANPRDIDGRNVRPGELVELLDVGGGGRAGRPVRVVRAIRAYGITGLLVAQPYERAYGGNPTGTGLALTFRRLADQNGGPTVWRSCGCPATVRDAIIPAPADGSGEWGAAIRHMDEMAAQDRRHGEGCEWADGRPTTAVRMVETYSDDERAELVIHDATGQPCACGVGVGTTGARQVDVASLYNPTALLWYRYPPTLYPHRDELPAVRLAPCIEPETAFAARYATAPASAGDPEPARAFVSGWASIPSTQ